MKSFIFMQGNPVHRGHMALFETALEHSETLDAFVSSKRQRPKDLPHEIRRHAVQVAIQNHDWADRVTVLDNALIEGGLFSIRSDVYDLLAMGSDVANHLVASTSKLKAGEADYFLSYRRLLVLQRPDSLLIEEGERELRARVQELIVCPPKIAYSASDVRKAYRAGKNISTLTPPNVWEVIEPHVECFNLET